MVICQRIIVTQAWKHAEIHEIGPVLKQLTMGNPHGCMAGSFFKICGEPQDKGQSTTVSGRECRRRESTDA